MSASELAQQLKTRFGDLISGPTEFRGEITVRLTDPECIADVCAFAKKELGFNYLVDISSVDNYGTDPRWTVVYHFYGYSHRCTLRLKTDVSEEKSELPTVTGVWKGADWHEREVYDMMGITFRNHPDLRRILMWDGYPYYPLRKDFPLSGKPSSVPEVAFTKTAPLEGGPFVTIAGGNTSTAREPRVRLPETDDVELNARLERRQDIKEAHGHSHGPGPVKMDEPKR
jgi:NADH-quinone oxidoreductase subunit C